MPRVINCDCGLTCRGDSDEELLTAAEAHIARDHPDLVGRISREDLLAMAEEA